MNMLSRALPVMCIAPIAIMAGCAGPAARDAADAAPAGWPAFEPPRPGETVYRVDRQVSQLFIRVDPAGPMARLGHSHVVGGPVLSGTIIAGKGLERARLDLAVDTDALAVDEPRWRAALELEPELDDQAVADTRANMRGEEVLDVAEYPTIAIRSAAIDGPEWMPRVTARIRLRGTAREMTTPVALLRSNDRIEAVGDFYLHQSDFGMEPFSTAGGALRVADRVHVRFRIIAVAGRGDVAIMRGRSEIPETRP